MAERPRRFGSTRDAAEAAFKSATTKPMDGPVDAPAAAPARPAVVAGANTLGLPNAREQVSLRIDRDVLERFQKDGAGWQDRINAALRKSVGL